MIKCLTKNFPDIYKNSFYLVLNPGVETESLNSRDLLGNLGFGIQFFLFDPRKSWKSQKTSDTKSTSVLRLIIFDT